MSCHGLFTCLRKYQRFWWQGLPRTLWRCFYNIQCRPHITFSKCKKKKEIFFGWGSVDTSEASHSDLASSKSWNYYKANSIFYLFLAQFLLSLLLLISFLLGKKRKTESDCRLLGKLLAFFFFKDHIDSTLSIVPRSGQVLLVAEVV